MPGKPVAEVTVLPMPPDSAGKGDWMTTARKVAFFRGASLRPVPLASPSTMRCATSTSARTTRSTRRNGELDPAGGPPARLGPVALRLLIVTRS